MTKIAKKAAVLSLVLVVATVSAVSAAGRLAPAAPPAVGPLVTDSAKHPRPGLLDGQWTVTYTWSGYPAGQTVWSIDAGIILGWCTTAEAQKCISIFNPQTRALTIRYLTSSAATFVGTLDAAGTTMSGTMSNNLGRSGTWTATKIVAAPVTAPHKPAGGLDSSGVER